MANRPSTGKRKPTALPQQGTDWQAEAEFWQLKYLELQNHSHQIINALGRNTMMNAVAKQFGGLAAMQQAAQQQQDDDSDDEQPEQGDVPA